MKRVASLVLLGALTTACGRYSHVTRPITRQELAGVWVATAASLQAAAEADPVFAASPGERRVMLAEDGSCAYESFLLHGQGRVEWLQRGSAACHWEVAIDD